MTDEATLHREAETASTGTGGHYDHLDAAEAHMEAIVDAGQGDPEVVEKVEEAQRLLAVAAEWAGNYQDESLTGR